MPIAVQQYRQAIARPRRPEIPAPPPPIDPLAIRRVSTPAQLLLGLLAISNATPAPARASSRPPLPAAPANCTRTGLAWSAPTVLHGIAHFLRAPVTTMATEIHNARLAAAGVRCAPPLPSGTRTLMQIGDYLAGMGEGVVLGGRGLLALRTTAAALDVAGDVVEGAPLQSGLAEDVVAAQAGVRMEVAPEVPNAPLQRLADTAPVRLGGCFTRPRSSIPLFDAAARAVAEQPPLGDSWRVTRLQHNGLLAMQSSDGAAAQAVRVDGRCYAATRHVDGSLHIGAIQLSLEDGLYGLAAGRTPSEPASASVRCARAPGAACGLPAPRYSTQLTRVLQWHHDQALTPSEARSRAIGPDALRPGWYVSHAGGRIRQYLKFNGHYFKVRSRQVDRYTERLSLYLPRRIRMGGQRLGPRPHRHHIADVRQSLVVQEQRFMTQAEFNVEYRGLPSLDAARVYESAIQNAAGLRVSQAQRAAIRSYLIHRRRSLDSYLQTLDASLGTREQAEAVARINRGLARIPPYEGRLYTALLFNEDGLADLQPGHTVYSRSFLVASGDRSRVQAGLRAHGRAAPGTRRVLVRLDTHRHAHPTGLLSLQEEAQAMIANNVVFRVVENQPGRLVLEELGPARQALGTLGAQPLRAVALPH